MLGDEERDPRCTERHCHFTCRLARGIYRFTVEARDLSRNPAQRPLGSNRLTVQWATGTMIDIPNVFVRALRKARRARVHWGIWRARRAGVTIGERCSFTDVPGFGAHPYLITLGRDVAMAAEVSFITKDGGTHVFTHLERYRKVIKYGRINIRDNCVIGERVMLLPGVTIGPDSVVAAGSVVARSIPPGVLAAGNPAKPVMTVHQYAEWALAATPDYDEASLARDEKAVLMRMYMRQLAARRFQQNARKTTKPQSPCQLD